MKTKKVKPYGMLYSNGREYFALSPIPAVSEDWEWDDGQEGVYRFEVVPRQKSYRDDCVYSFARHIVTNNFTIEYADMPEINIKELEIGDE
jgi:hypothetical protein